MRFANYTANVRESHLLLFCSLPIYPCLLVLLLQFLRLNIRFHLWRKRFGSPILLAYVQDPQKFYPFFFHSPKIYKFLVLVGRIIRSHPPPGARTSSVENLLDVFPSSPVKCSLCGEHHTCEEPKSWLLNCLGQSLPTLCSDVPPNIDAPPQVVTLCAVGRVLKASALVLVCSATYNALVSATLSC